MVCRVQGPLPCWACGSTSMLALACEAMYAAAQEYQKAGYHVTSNLWSGRGLQCELMSIA